LELLIEYQLFRRCLLSSPFTTTASWGYSGMVLWSSSLKWPAEWCKGVIRIFDQTVYKWTFNCGACTNTRDDLLGVWETMTLATWLDIIDIKVLGDSRIVIDRLNYKGNLKVFSLDCWKDRIRDLIKTSRAINFSHIYQ
jgi:ribonuclease HI